MQFQNGFNKVVTELSGVQFSSEIILLISITGSVTIMNTLRLISYPRAGR